MRIRPGRTRSLITGIVALIVTAVGLVIIPGSSPMGGFPGIGSGIGGIFGLFKILWAGIGLIGAGASFYNAFSHKGIALYEVSGEPDYPDEDAASSYCPQCGRPVNNDDRFCRNCGAKLA